jgi:hypothetical protein
VVDRLRRRGVYPKTMSQFAASSLIFEPLSGAKSRQRLVWPLGSRLRICLNCPSSSLPGKPLMKHSVVSSFLSLPDSHMNVRCGAALVGNWLDCPEIELAARARQEAAVSLEIRRLLTDLHQERPKRRPFGLESQSPAPRTKGFQRHQRPRFSIPFIVASHNLKSVKYSVASRDNRVDFDE